MRTSRRAFLGAATAAAVAAHLPRAEAKEPEPTDEQLREVQAQKVLTLDGLARPIVIESMELLRNGGEFLVRVRSKDGAEGVIVAQSSKMRDTYPIFLNRVAPFFRGKDARAIEDLLLDVYRHGSNYKFQGLAFWVCVAAAEMAILELLGRASGRSIGEMFGGVKRRDIAVYRASSNRGNAPESEVKHLRGLVESIGAKALKFRLGGRMSNNKDSRPGRTEALIPLVRREFGDDMTLYADSNSSYDVPNSIRIGRLLEEHKYAFFEEPVPFDHLWETKKVADALKIPVAGGEQEFSLRRFRWAILNRAVDIVQPDLMYFGGFIRSTKVARMADAAKMPCTCHMSGAGLGYVYVLHFASYARDPGAHQEYKGGSRVPVVCKTSSLKCKNGVIRCPSGPGFGVDIDPKYVSAAKRV
jgi:L-alanine-DL-glutamate epimerase-like enolase superfamily enzyme